MFQTIKDSIIYVLSLDLILALSSTWLYSFQTNMSIVLSFCLGLSGLIVSIFSIIHLFLKVKSIKLDNILKELEILEKRKENTSQRIKRK